MSTLHDYTPGGKLALPYDQQIQQDSPVPLETIEDTTLYSMVTLRLKG